MKATLIILYVLCFFIFGSVLFFGNEGLEEAVGFKKETASTYISFLAFIISGVNIFKWHDETRKNLYIKARFDSPTERNLIFEVTNKSAFPITIVDFGHTNKKNPFSRISTFHSQRTWQNIVNVENENSVPFTIGSNQYKSFSYNFVTQDPEKKGFGYIITSDDKKIYTRKILFEN